MGRRGGAEADGVSSFSPPLLLLPPASHLQGITTKMFCFDIDREGWGRGRKYRKQKKGKEREASSLKKFW